MAEHKYIGNVIYSSQSVHGRKKNLFMDVALPDSAVWGGPYPVILLIHGGTWVGNRFDVGDLPWHYVDDHGFALVRFDYRSAYDAPFPAQIADCRSAVRFLRKHAAEYNIDPNRFGVKGGSAGGHLAAMLGVSDGAEGLDNPNDDLDISVAVQAVVDDFGPTNILELWRLLDILYQAMGSLPFSSARKNLWKELKDNPNVNENFMSAGLKFLTYIPGIQYIASHFTSPNNYIRIASLLSGGDILRSEELLRRVSPIEYIARSLRKDGRKIPPFRILHGEEDMCVPFVQSKTFAKELLKVGTDVTFDTDCGGQGHFPSCEHWKKVIGPKEVAFFERVLGVQNRFS